MAKENTYLLLSLLGNCVLLLCIGKISFEGQNAPRETGVAINDQARDQPSSRATHSPSTLPTRANEQRRYVNCYERLLATRASLKDDFTTFFSTGTEAKDVSQEIFSELCKSDPVRAFKIACEIPSSARLDRIGRALANAFRTHPDDAFRLINEVSQFRLTISSSRFDKILETPEKYLSRILQLPGRAASYRRKLVRQVASKMYADNPQKTSEWIETLNPSVQSLAIKGMYSVWFSEEPAENLTLDPTIQRNLRAVLAERSVAILADKDPQQALAWIDQELSGLAKENAKYGLVTRLARRDDLSSASELVARMPIGTSRQFAASGLLEVWASRNPQIALAWINSLTDDGFPEKARWFTNVAGYWYASNPTEVLAFVQANTNELSPNFIAGVAERMAMEDMNSAIQWARSLPEPNNSVAEQRLMEVSKH